MNFIKTKDRLPVGTTVARNTKLKITGEMSVHDDYVTFSGYPSYHVQLEFSSPELFEDYEWLDESESTPTTGYSREQIYNIIKPLMIPGGNQDVRLGATHLKSIILEHLASLPSLPVEDWIRVEDRLPTLEDAGEKGYVMVNLRTDRIWEWSLNIGIVKWDRVKSTSHKYWRKLPPLPAPPTENKKV
jgi:predicted DNA-binding transcriptional regulator AlpA